MCVGEVGGVCGVGGVRGCGVGGVRGCTVNNYVIMSHYLLCEDRRLRVLCLVGPHSLVSIQ